VIRRERLFGAIIAGVAALFSGVVAGAETINFQLNTGKRGQNVLLASDIFRWQDALPMKETAPGQYSVSMVEPWLYRMEYKFIVDGHWIPDPGNSELASDGMGGWNSVRHVDFREDPILGASDPGSFVRNEITVRDWEGDSRIIKVVRPRNTRGKRLVVVYFNDGDGYLEYANAENLLANLSKDPKMPAFAGVFLNAKDRDREYYANDDYAAFVARTVVPAVERTLNAKIQPTDRLIIGISLGGLSSFYITLKHPDVFPFVTSQSGSLWFEPSRMHRILRKLSGRKLRFVIQMGLYDESDMVSSSREMARALEGMGFDVIHTEFPGTHDWVPWRNLLQQTLRHFFETR